VDASSDDAPGSRINSLGEGVRTPDRRDPHIDPSPRGSPRPFAEKHPREADAERLFERQHVLVHVVDRTVNVADSAENHGGRWRPPPRARWVVSFTQDFS
jgi:hypothetical protein